MKIINELNTHRDLLAMLVARNIKIRYKNSALGFLWSFLVPLSMIVLYSVFLRVMRFPIDLPALVTAIIVWQFLATCLGDSLYAVVGNANLVTKAAFPRTILPLSMVLANFVNFLLSAVVLLVYVAIDPGPFGAPLWLVPAMLCHLLLCTGMAFALSASNVFFRDTEHVLSMLMTAWFFLSPIIYPLEMITTMEPWIARLYFLNPMAGIVTAYRMALVGEAGPGIIYLLISFGVAVCIAICGIAFFRKMEDRFGDEL